VRHARRVVEVRPEAEHHPRVDGLELVEVEVE
jgi:hypothetical protein